MSEVKSDKGVDKSQSSASGSLAGLEKWAHETFDTKNPVKIPDGGRKWIADNAWWLAAIGGVLSLLAALSMWQGARYFTLLINDVSYLTGQNALLPNVSLWWYVLLLITVVEGIVLLFAVSKLKQQQKAGWNLLFYLSLAMTLFGVVSVFTPGYGIGSLIASLLGVAITWTILMQIRSYFK